MQSTKIGADFCRAQNYHRNNTSFKAKFSNETIAKMGEEKTSNPLQLYQDILEVSKKVKDYGSKDTIITIENPRGNTKHYSSDISWSDGFCSSGSSPMGQSWEPELVSYTESKSTANLIFKHPLFGDLSTSKYTELDNVDISAEEKRNSHLSFATHIKASDIEKGEEGLAIAYVKDLMAKCGNNGSLVEASKEFLHKLELSDFSKNAITTIKNATKYIDLKNKLEARVTQLLKI